MLRLSVRFTQHHDANRRYEDFAFYVEGNRLVEFFSLAEDKELKHRCPVCKDSGTVQVFDPCPRCDSVGCPHCDEGLVMRSITCNCRREQRSAR